jgi:hypothetical protein
MHKREWIILIIAAVVFVVTYWLTSDCTKLATTWQIVFWFGALTLAVLTYVNARQSLLQPFRTEVFKIQLRELEATLAFFVGKNEWELREQFGLMPLVERNAVQVLEHFAKVIFAASYVPRNGMANDGEGSAYRPLHRDSYHAVTTPLWLEPEYKSQPERRGVWATYKLPSLHSPRVTMDGIRQLRNMLAQAFLPNGVRHELEAYIRNVESLEQLLEEILTDCAKELPERFDSVASLNEIRDGETAVGWMYNTFNHRMHERQMLLRPRADAVQRAIREYLEVENLLSL